MNLYICMYGGGNIKANLRVRKQCAKLIEFQSHFYGGALNSSVAECIFTLYI